MRKKMMTISPQEPSLPDHGWLDLDALAEVEISSEDMDYPIESALLPGHASGWRAAMPGEQVIRLVFDQPQRLQRIRLNFVETHIERTQEYILRWSADDGASFQDIVRQQWNFSPEGTTCETEEHQLDLQGVTVLELSIIPDMGGAAVCASLEQLALA